MDSFELNKVAGAILGAGVFAMGLGFVSDLLFSTHPPETPGYLIEVAEAAPTAEGAAAPAATPLPVLLAQADVAKGESVSKKCTACHSFEKGGPNKVGPDLWGVVDREIAHAPGFGYSSGMLAFAEQEKTWTYAHLDAFLANPRGVVNGTAMSFAGVKNDQERADLIAYLRTLADSPVPLPPVEEAAASTETPPAAGHDPAASTASPGEAPAAHDAPAAATPPPANEPPADAPASEPAAPAQ
jgi:cytochrome c